MRRLSERDASAALAFVSELKELDEPLPFAPSLIARLQQLIASDWAGYSELDPVRQGSILQVWRNADGEEGVAWGDDDLQPGNDVWWRLRHTHPVCGIEPRAANGQPLARSPTS